MARYGGEELAVVMPETDAKAASVVAERIRIAVAELSVPYDVRSLSVTISLGVATLAKTMPDAQSLVRAADAALYESKAAGRNRVSVA